MLFTFTSIIMFFILLIYSFIFFQYFFFHWFLPEKMQWWFHLVAVIMANVRRKKKHDNYINKYNTNNFKGINNNKHDNCRASKCVCVEYLQYFQLKKLKWLLFINVQLNGLVGYYYISICIAKNKLSGIFRVYNHFIIGIVGTTKILPEGEHKWDYYSQIQRKKRPTTINSFRFTFIHLRD